ncbi:Multimeric flavodoxin WrbA [Sporobacter termitidis DSM 10068]|uniref:Multimeric flavodoxin WrbA n=1 Tax=Sporobacter termitidis DSM 10068 TaxID=1123282 RepID=A0A1M5XPB0_9FIRM|nr:NAD(P)H-dependent oxidoreductase [Sporobacter termitidis]SHI01569.1 Multimeric flavodoxin WrbA [Sporobacter termitidis DSM 10068]
MKVLAIIGSPRKKGNTYHVVGQIRENMLRADPDIDFEYLFLRDSNLQMCTGCFVCIARGEDSCPLKDDRDLIRAKLSEADGLIFAAPGYAMGVPGLMKNFIDRFAYTCHRPCFFDKTILAVTTIGAARGMKQTLSQLAVLAGGGRVMKLGVTMPPIPMTGAARAKRKIDKASAAFYDALKEQKKRLPAIEDWGWFYAFKTFCSVEAYQKACPADIAYYKDKAEYFYPLRGHYARRLLGKAFKGIFKLSIGLMVERPPLGRPFRRL